MLKLESERLYLRPITVSDATEDYVNWLNDPVTTQYLAHDAGNETRESVARYIEKYEDRDDVLFLAIVMKEGDRHVGNLKFEPIRKKHGNAILGIMIGEPSARGKGVGKEAIVTALGHVFRDRKLHRVGLFVASDNEPAVRCYEKIGFVVEGRFREAIRRGDSYVDDLGMGILATDYFSLHDSPA